MVDVHTKINEMCDNAITSPWLIYIYMIPDKYALGFVGKKPNARSFFWGLVKHMGMGIIDMEQHSIITLHKPLFW
jgi:hypothetical protein